jgi:hypothetical protein
MKMRNYAAQVAQFRNSSGFMHDRRLQRGGDLNTVRELVEEYESEKYFEVEFVGENTED